MTARRCGIRDICAITGYSRDKVQAALKRSPHQITPKQKHYDTLQVDEFHTFVGHIVKRNKKYSTEHPQNTNTKAISFSTLV